jgi:spore maturation protein CgeB
VRIAFFGSSLVSAYWNGAATYYRGLLRALAERGHSITFYEPDAFERQQHRDIDDPDWARVVVYDATEAAVLAALRDARAADVIVKASGVGVFDDLLAEAVIEARRPGALAAYWDVDAPATLDLLRRDPDDPFVALIPHYDLVFTYGGGERVVSEYLSHGARACVPIYNALDPDTHFPVAAQPQLAADLSFVGNRLPDREARVASFFLEAARLSPERRFLLGGSGWQDCTLPANVTTIGHVYTAQHNALNCSALAVLNINRESMADFGFSPPTRVFEAAGAGACLITDAWRGIELFLEPGEEVLIAADGAEVATLLAELTPERARRIGTAARRRILARHTYAERARIVEETLAGVRTDAGEVPS